MARARASAPRDEREDLAEIESWYRWRLLDEPAELPNPRWEPVYIGPTWRTEKVNGVLRWVLPERTLGWECLAWCGKYLQQTRGLPWQFTAEQARFLLHWYSVEEDGRWTYRDFVFQRLKGHGKDPLGCCLCLFEMVGNCRVAEIRGNTVIGEDHPDAWVQTAAVALKQTKNTMRLLPGLLTPLARSTYGISPGKENVYAVRDTRLFEAVTSSPETLEGARASLVLKNETQHWLPTNSGHDMQEVIERNATKSPGGAARTGSITNAFEMGLDSVAERDREAFDANLVEGKAASVRLLYDSIEAHPEAPLTVQDAPAVIESVRGDSTWLDVPTIVDSITDVRNAPSTSRRFWYNQVSGAEDAWVKPPQLWDANAQPGQLALPGERVVMFFDGSKSQDSTGLVGCRLSDGLLWRIGAWVPEKLASGEKRVDRESVDEAVRNAMDSWKVVAFWGDPSHALDDEAEAYWDGYFDQWHIRYAKRLLTWARKDGDSQHSVMWDMSNHLNAQRFTLAAMQMTVEVKDGQVPHDGDRLLRQHVFNARRRPNKWGVSLGKASRDSTKKVDLAVCAVGARMLRRVVLNRGAGQRQRSGNVW